MAKSLKVLVTGATGKQGGAVSRRLLERGHRVRALTRDPASAAAKHVAGKGAELVRGDLTDEPLLAKAIEGVDAVFGMTTPTEAGVDAERQQGVMLANAAKKAGVHLVFSSVASADKGTGIPHFESKHQVERHIRAIGATATIVAPAYFMENVIAFGRAQLERGLYALPLPPQRKLQQIALDDLGAFVVLAFEKPDRYVGKRYDLASDELTGEQAAAILTRVLGRNIRYYQASLDDVRSHSTDMAVMFEWFERVGYDVDVRSLHRNHPEVGWHGFEAWAKRQNWKQILSRQTKP